MADLKKIKRLFWREAEEQSVTSSPKEVDILAPIPMQEEVPKSAPASDSEFYGAIEKAIASAMPAEFAEFYNQMSVINEKFPNLDKATRYQLAFHAAQTALKTRNQQLTPAILSKSLDSLTRTLETEKQEFEAANEQSYRDNYRKVEQKVQQMSQGIKERESRLQILQQEIEAFLAAKNAEKKKLEDERMQMISQRIIAESEMNQLKQKKAERENLFNAALEAHRQRLQELKIELEENLKQIK
ncbi:MAG: hypothetical protein ONB31_00205 [candidate division KSB1 bacterium]|nr:hypothetical protein [candidate division KSB1 bacterium]MDZ7336452.1 hypothetical protein [candidate division KSB1 bacterium]MDZ7356272.1 hypothetical protein [candidate division KSB1 bacterium]MDZ7400077.1 hypothetical protein [candidate division KSB1 bacterium]